MRRAFAPLAQGATLDTLPPATADGLAACECRMADLDAYVTLLGYLITPFPRVGYVVVSRAPFAAAAKAATVGDVVAALPIPR